ncbi:ribose 1,5-bisphosphokinase [Bradyrhizobium sp. USDA 4503]
MQVAAMRRVCRRILTEESTTGIEPDIATRDEVFARRFITRPASVGEDHEPIEIAEFWRRIECDAFALHWEAHGLHYGLLKLIDNWLDQSHVVVANGSRSVVPEARRRYANLPVIRITASPAVLAERLAMRGREGNKAQKERIARSGTINIDLNDALTIDNSGNLIFTGNQFIETVLSELPADTHIEQYAGRGNDA